jgi:hypothetical protein
MFWIDGIDDIETLPSDFAIATLLEFVSDQIDQAR